MGKIELPFKTTILARRSVENEHSVPGVVSGAHCATNTTDYAKMNKVIEEYMCNYKN